jgi:ATP-dependent Clp protease ATP-binding subunit ClpA
MPEYSIDDIEGPENGHPGDQIDDREGVAEVPPVERLSEAVMRVIGRAAAMSCARGHSQVTTDDLFGAILQERGCAAVEAIESLGLAPDDLLRSYDFVLGLVAQQAPAHPADLTLRAQSALEAARLEAGRRGADVVETTYLLMGLLKERRGVAALLLETPGVGLEPVGAALNRAFRERKTDPS